MKRFLGTLVVIAVFTFLVASARPDIKPEIKWSDLPDSIKSDAVAARMAAGAHVFTDQGMIYLLVSVGEARQSEAHLRLLRKNTLDNLTQTLTVHFEQYAPDTGKPGATSADDWFRILVFKDSSPKQIKVVVDGVERYTVAVPE